MSINISLHPFQPVDCATCDGNGWRKKSFRDNWQQLSSRNFANCKKYCDYLIWLLFHSRDFFSISSSTSWLMYSYWVTVDYHSQPDFNKDLPHMHEVFLFQLWINRFLWSSTVSLNSWLNLTIWCFILLNASSWVLVARKNASKAWLVK